MVWTRDVDEKIRKCYIQMEGKLPKGRPISSEISSANYLTKEFLNSLEGSWFLKKKNPEQSVFVENES